MSSQPEAIDLATVPLQELKEIYDNLDQTLNYLTKSLQQLKSAQGRFVDSERNLDTLKPENADKPMLVPLTKSMYVPGSLKGVTTVMVDIGTGYYVELTVEKARGYFQRRIKDLTETLEKLQAVAVARSKQKNSVEELLQFRIQEQQQMMQRLQQQQQQVAQQKGQKA
eukprot:m.62723 g.62723  ORF g.62723 m.62723 type:complete len:168 (+) comp13803_c0_seq1:11-514(+)